VTAGPVAPVARQPSRAPSRNPTPPPRPHPAAAPTQRVRRGRSRATGQRCLRRPQQWGPGRVRTFAAGRRTYGVTPGARRGADGRAVSRAGRPRRPSRQAGGTRSSKPGPLGFRRETRRGPRSGPRRTAGHRPLPYGRSRPSATRGAERGPGTPRPRRGRLEPRFTGGVRHPRRGGPWGHPWRPRGRARWQRVSACRRRLPPWRDRAATRSTRRLASPRAARGVGRGRAGSVLASP